MVKQINQNGEQPSAKQEMYRIFLTSLIIYLILSMFIKKPETKEIVSSNNPVVVKKEFNTRKSISFDGKLLKGNINNYGIKIDDIVLKDYKQTTSKDSDHVKLFTPKFNKDKSENIDPYYAEFGWISQSEGMNMPNEKTLWKITKDNLKNNGVLELRWTNKKGLTFIRKYTFDDKYMLNVSQTVKNNSTGDIVLSNYGIISKTVDLKAKASRVHNGFVSFLDNDLEEYNFKELKKEKSISSNVKNGWVGLTDDYFASAFILPKGDEVKAIRFLHSNSALQTPAIPSAASTQNSDKTDYQTFQADFVSSLSVIKKGQSKTVSTDLFIGAKKSDILKGYQKEGKAYKLNLLIDYGSFYIISKPFSALLKALYDLFGSMGLAIILFAIITRIVLFPIFYKQIKSMNKMKKLQPELKKIQTYYAHDKMRMQMEMAMLYKKYKVNPVSGCLPLLIQLPVFFALYKVLMISIEMRHAPFMGFIKDLSGKDPTSLFNLFGLLPYNVPSFIPNVSLLAIIFGATMFIQQKMQPQTGMDPNNPMAKAIKFMPFMMAFLGSMFPSGLVLYYSMSNILGIIQQEVVTLLEDKKKK